MKLRLLLAVLWGALALLSANCGDAPPFTMRNAVAPQVTPTYDHSGNAVEPTLEYFPGGWNGYRYWLAISPYPHSNALLENPSLLVSQDGNNWSVPPGLVNPIALPSANGHLGDGTIYFDNSSNELWAYYLEQIAMEGELFRKRSADGIHWTPAEPLLNAPAYAFLSPTVQRLGNEYMMWSVNSGTVGCTASSTSVELRTSPDGIHWSEPQTTGLVQPNYRIWHINVKWIPATHEFLALYSAFQKTCANDSLFLARSPDGMHWKTSAAPLLVPNPGHWDGIAIYRATGFLDPRTLSFRVWYSAEGTMGWRLGYTDKSN
ncbi:MAG: hypothetical protein ACM3JB_22680 [Acidobacteriaceae bacterium]